MNDLSIEITMIMNYFAMVDQCQNLGRNGYSTDMTLRGMHFIEKEVKKALTFDATTKLFDQLEKIYFPTRE